MSKKQPESNNAESLASATSKTMRSRWLSLAVILLAIIIIVLVSRRTKEGQGSSQTITSTNDSIATATVQPSLETSLKQLDGKWQRTDGGYVLQFQQITPDGKIETTYFNPKPIHVGRSGWQHKSGQIVVGVELQDVNYPGSIYTLVFIPQENRLAGTYYQAVEKETYDVEFRKVQ